MTQNHGPKTIVMAGPFGLRPRGTMSVRALPMAKALAAQGHRVTLLMPPWQNPEDSGRRWIEEGVTIEHIPLPPRIPGLFHLLIAARLARRIQALHPDAAHLFKPKAYSGLTHWLLAHLPARRRPRLVVDADDWEGPGGWNEIGGYTPAQRRFFAWQERWGLTHADVVTVASRTLESLVWALGVPPRRVRYIPNGVWLPPDPLPRTTDVEHPAILLYTRFFEFDISRVIELMRCVRQQFPGARLLVAGTGLRGEEEALFRQAAQAGMSAQREVPIPPSPCPPAFLSSADIISFGWVPPKALPVCFAMASLAIYPFDDTLINRAKCAVKLLDLLAAGMPVVAEAVGENREMIRHGETGWLVESGDTAAFASAVAHLLEDAPLRERLGGAAARDVRVRYAWERLARAAASCYQPSGDRGTA